MKIFISFKHEDSDYREAIEGVILNPNTKYIDSPVSSRKDVRVGGKIAIEKYIRNLMRDCQTVFVLIGQNTHNAPWVSHEINVALSQKKNIIPIRIPDTTGGLPFQIRDYRIIDWDQKKILKELN
jgi:hypothetical protein